MLKRFPKVFLVATSLAPILLTLSFLAVRAHHYRRGAIWFGATAVIILSTMALLWQAKRELEVLPVHIDSAKTADREVIGFLLAYVLPLALTSGTELRVDGWAIAFLITLFGVVIWGTHAYDFNPLLGIIGYHFFEIETAGGITYVLITKRNIVSVQQITSVVQLTEYVLLDKN